MKYIPILSAVAIISFGLISYSQQNFDPSGDSELAMGPKMVRVHAEYYEITTLEYAEIMGKEKLGSDDTKLRERLLEMAKKGDAKLLEAQTVSSRSGEKSSLESITEYIYPTEYEPPYTDVKTEKGVEETSTSYLTPIAFEVRNLGATFEVEPTIGDDGKTIDLRLVPEIVTLIDHSVWGHSIETNTPIKMPTFYTYRLNTAISVTKGQFHMAGVFTPKDDQNKADPAKKLLFFVKAELLAVGR